MSKQWSQLRPPRRLRLLSSFAHPFIVWSDVGDAENWITDLAEKAKKLKVGPGNDSTVDVGPMISPAAKARIEGLIESADRQGATLVLDGRSPEIAGFRVEISWVLQSSPT